MNMIITWSIVALIIVLVVIALLATFFKRSTREFSLIRTGLGGRKVVMDGGVVVLPYFHDITRVNMQTLRFEVNRSADQSLITKDRMRVDVGVEFYVSVDPSVDGISRAAQTLGGRTSNPDKLHELIDGKLIDTLRSVAARMTLDELHENRGEFVAEVRKSVAESLSRNGLALESVSLTSLDQTPFNSLDENNAFNAVGMRRLAEVIANSKKERALIDRDAEVAVHRSTMEASKLKLSIDLEQQAAELEQVREIETLRAKQLSEIAMRKAESEKSSNAARIEMERAIRTDDIAREQAISEAEIARATALEVAEQARNIAVASQSQEESKALAAADLTRAEAVTAAEAITTAREVADAKRRKEVALVQAQQRSAISTEELVAKAQAEARAAVEQAKATLAAAEARASVNKMRLEATKAKLSTKAEARRALNEADNVLSSEVMALKAELAKLETLPLIVAQMVKPAEKIESINIHHLSGLGVGSGGAGSTDQQKPVVNQALDSVLDMAVQLPALKKLGEELGISMEKGVTGITENIDKK
ncbi:flotillin [Chromatiales bacterium (ex Bugula neritina AB1)]|nr:flotillin [Chromatiales bacterium (ex Bugula neritina AB1)]